MSSTPRPDLARAEALGVKVKNDDGTARKTSEIFEDITKKLAELQAGSASGGGQEQLWFELGDGNKMPAVGMGTWQVTDDDAEKAVAAALKAGYKHVDTAEAYNNEGGVGRGLAASGVARESVFITTKVWPGNDAWGMPVKSYDDTVAACKASVEKLGVKQVDLYLVHVPLGGGKEGRLAQYQALVECQKQGLVKSIGVSNFDIAHLKELEEAGLPTPAANQLELHPHQQKKELLEYMKGKKILPIAYSSLAPLSTWREGYTEQVGGSKTDEEKATPSPVADIAKRLGVSEARVLLRYALQKGWCVLPKSTREERIKENLDLFSFVIPDEDMATLDGLPEKPAMAFGSPGQAFDPTKCD